MAYTVGAASVNAGRPGSIYPSERQAEYKDLPLAVQPHRELMKELIPKMQAIEHGWRNRMIHVENKLVPTDGIGPEIAAEVMNATKAFMRMLGEKLPLGF
jgi:hypothetical protein